MKLNRDEIVKALEWCSSGGNCIKCRENNKNPFLSKEGCMAVQMRNALALINQLTEDNTKLANMLLEKDVIILEQGKFVDENERLKTELRQTAQKLNTVICLNDKLTADNEWIKTRRMPEEKTETIRKMQFRLCQHFCHDPAFLGVEQRLIMGVIDQIAKEMEEG